MAKDMITRYNALLKRSFKSRLDIVLFGKLLSGKNIDELNFEQFLMYEVTDELVHDYENAWQRKAHEEFKGKSVAEIDKAFDNWYNRNILLEADLRSAYYKHFEQHLSLEDFSSKCNEAKCSYCDISEKNIAAMKAKGLIKTKRGRGSIMEIDRLNSNQEYTAKNIVLACYWCNNAKTDEFTPEEFKAHVAPGIKAVWQARLKSMEQ